MHFVRRYNLSPHSGRFCLYVMCDVEQLLLSFAFSLALALSSYHSLCLGWMSVCYLSIERRCLFCCLLTVMCLGFFLRVHTNMLCNSSCERIDKIPLILCYCASNSRRHHRRHRRRWDYLQENRKWRRWKLIKETQQKRQHSYKA